MTSKIIKTYQNHLTFIGTLEVCLRPNIFSQWPTAYYLSVINARNIGFNRTENLYESTDNIKTQFI